MADRCEESNNLLLSVGERMLKTKTPNKVKTAGFKSDFQLRIWKYEPEALNRILEEF